ncbi:MULTISPECIES: hypothetical protein [Haloarcula]|uniref:hypothetical protein n=1 Tax=Haloarcula TaxID=2237 RepID=UPI000F8D7E48|nr:MULTISPECIES: hypothetical protein [Haloarcula]NHX42009.1 hypothetical protein [Haloarcula sp. R1-2]
MVDPLATSALSGLANAAGSRVIESFVKGEDDHTEWKQQVIDAATEAEAARRFAVDLGHYPDRDGLKQIMGQLGKQIAKLEVIGERRGYPDEEVERVHELAEICGNYATAENYNSGAAERELSDELPEVLEQIYAFVE